MNSDRKRVINSENGLTGQGKHSEHILPESYRNTAVILELNIERIMDIKKSTWKKKVKEKVLQVVSS